MVRKHRKIIIKEGWDKPLFYTVIALMFFGCLMVYSASSPYAIKEYGNPQYFFYRDLIFSVFSCFLIWIVSLISYRHYQKWSGIIYILALLSCLLVFVPGIRHMLNNAHRWVRLGPITYMPSDGLKVAVIIFMAAQLSRRPAEENGNWRMLFSVFVFLGITVLPVYIQPNFSAVVVISVSILFMYFIGGMKLRHIIPMSILAAIILVIVFWPREGNYRLERLLIIFNPLRDPTDSAWQLIQSLYAVASGGMFGVGFGRSAQKFDYLAAEPHNDFIFSVIAEELGFVGALLLIMAFCFIAYRGLVIAKEADSTFSRYLALGLTFIISFQAMINIGVAIGLMPTTGITLPFLSYGGSSLMVMSAMVGILLNISRNRKVLN